ncbi:hypothetical protein [Sporosarcina thermotolerans]|uniref:hypothetical protein n=1 Tax=Sporosarcina thermotolerans TaxID=633404 RepID=UPI0024BCE8E7|nr:hypothetical protein [Sporosarcina thermotolerans]WHT48649.1 hypothetical protein QNH10_02290 [Sporosarcina thermotolerans]
MAQEEGNLLAVLIRKNETHISDLASIKMPIVFFCAILRKWVLILRKWVLILVKGEDMWRKGELFWVKGEVM